MIKLYFKAINFFQNVLLIKHCYNIKLNIENLVSLYYYNQQFVKKDQQYFVFINREKFLKETQINFQFEFKSNKNAIIYFQKF